MRIDRDTAEEILATLLRNKSRSLLTAFGVFWGIFMLVSLVGGGNGWQDTMKYNFDGFATNSCFIATNRTGEAYKGFRKGRYWRLENRDIENIRKSVAGIDVITASVASWGKTAVHADKKYSCAVKGLYPEYDAIERQDLLYGRFINEIDIRDRRKVCVLGKRVYEALYNKGEDPCGSLVRVDGIYYRVVGVVSTPENVNLQGNGSEQVMLPFSVYQTTYNCGDQVDVLAISLKPGVKVADLKPQIEAIIKSAHSIAPSDKQAIWMLDAEAMFSMVDNLFIGIKALVFLVGLGTLIAGIIGVSNIMMVTVKERTVEIGIRRAIGAQPHDIMQQILAESVVLTLVAGMFGICAGVGLLSVFEQVSVSDTGHVFAFQVSFGTALGMLALIVTLGIVAGLAPAFRAMSVKPVEAMRDE